jgi:hypothetical protein
MGSRRTVVSGQASLGLASLGLISVGLVALSGCSAAGPSSGGTRTSTDTSTGSPVPRPYYTEWRPGTPLPKLPSGYVVVAWPPSQVLSKLKPGQTVPVVLVKPGTRAQEIKRYKHLENSAGIVNVELEPETP